MQKDYGFQSNALNSTGESPRKWLPGSFSREERRRIRKKLKEELHYVQSVSVRLNARLNELRGKPSANGEKRLSASGQLSIDITNQGRMPRQLSMQVSDSLTPGAHGKRTPKANSAYINNDFLSGREKIPPAEKLKSKSLGIKRGLLGRPFESREMKRQRIEALQSKRMAELLKQCGTILKKLAQHKFYWVFSEPVDVVKLKIFDYHSIVKKPMDLGTVGSKLKSGQYIHPSYFADDCRLVFSNAVLYNGKGHEVSFMAEELRKIFEGGYAKIEEKLEEEAERTRQEDEILNADLQQEFHTEEGYRETLQRDESRGNGEGASAKAKPSSKPLPKSASVTVSKTKPVDSKKQMTFEEKKRLSVNLGKLPGDRLGKIVQIISERNPHLSQSEDEIELDIDNLDNETLWELDRYVANCMKSKSKNKRKPAEDEPSREVIPTQGIGQDASGGNVYNGEVDDDVDIGDDDMPSSSLVPVVIEKDQKENAAVKSSSSSSSSSEDSASSSSDSDSGSSSASEPERNKKNKTSEISKTFDEIPSNKIEKIEKNVASTSTADDLKNEKESIEKKRNEEDKDKEGDEEEKAEEKKTEDKVMTEAEVRAALLRGKYADSILNAQKKKFERIDPKKAIELEKKQKEERARLEAEAKAADALRRRKEQEYQMELKRKREEERQAARKALLEMERTVEIGDNVEILKDLHFLSNNHPSSKQSASSHLPNHEMEGGENPLEMFGLYRKDDEEEEEEDEEREENEEVEEEGEDVYDEDGKGVEVEEEEEDNEMEGVEREERVDEEDKDVDENDGNGDGSEEYKENEEEMENEETEKLDGVNVDVVVTDEIMDERKEEEESKEVEDVAMQEKEADENIQEDVEDGSDENEKEKMDGGIDMSMEDKMVENEIENDDGDGDKSVDESIRENDEGENDNENEDNENEDNENGIEGENGVDEEIENEENENENEKDKEENEDEDENAIDNENEKIVRGNGTGDVDDENDIESDI